MALLTVQTISQAGLGPTYGAAAGGGDSFVNNGNVFVHIKNGDASPHTITIDSQVNCNQGVDHDLAVVVPASGERIIGPLPQSRFNDANSQVQMTYDGVTSVTIGVFALPIT